MTVSGQPAVNYTYGSADRLTQITKGSSVVSSTYEDFSEDFRDAVD